MAAFLGGSSAATVVKTAPRAHSHPGSHSNVAVSAHKLIWADNFNGPAGAPPDPAKWHVVTWPAGKGDDELEYYTTRPSNVSLDGAGHLVITARHETYTGDGVSRSYTSARIETKGLFQTTYGELEARISVGVGVEAIVFTAFL